MRYRLLLRVAGPGRRQDVAVDLSHEQLMTAHRMQTQVGPVFPLVQGDGSGSPCAVEGTTWW